MQTKIPVDVHNRGHTGLTGGKRAARKKLGNNISTNHQPRIRSIHPPGAVCWRLGFLHRMVVPKHAPWSLSSASRSSSTREHSISLPNLHAHCYRRLCCMKQPFFSRYLISSHTFFCRDDRLHLSAGPQDRVFRSDPKYAPSGSPGRARAARLKGPGL
jgi:hypothetical protein